MPLYRYRARSYEGQIVENTIQANTEKEVVDKLRSMNLMPITIEETVSLGSASFWKKLSLVFHKVTLKDMVIFCRQLATLLSAGINLGSALEVLTEQTENAFLAKKIKEVKVMVDRGVSFSTALKEAGIFPPLLVATVKAGEAGGVLDVVLNRIATFFEAQDRLKKKIISAVTYPAVVFSVAIVVVILLVSYVIPKFSKVFRSMGIELPFITELLFRFAELLSKYWYVPLLMVVFIVMAFKILGKLKPTKPYIDRFYMNLPIVGDIITKTVLVRSIRTLATLVEAGVPILEALEMASDVSNNAVIEKAFTEIKEALRHGKSMGEVMKKFRVFPPMVSHMVKVGEETGQLEEMLNKIADWYEVELEEKIKRLTSIIEPILVVVVGGIVAFVALSIFFPIISLITKFS